MGNDNSKKIGGVSSTKHLKEVQKTESVSDVQAVDAASGVGRVHGVGSVQKRRATHVMSHAERENLMRMITEEADKLFVEGALPASKKALVASAVKMAVDAGILPPEDESGAK